VQGQGRRSCLHHRRRGNLAERLRTPLRIEQHLILAFEHGFRCGEKPVTADVGGKRNPCSSPKAGYGESERLFLALFTE
jgi:hypothetical protein